MQLVQSRLFAVFFFDIVDVLEQGAVTCCI